MIFFALICLAGLSGLYFYSAVGGSLLLTERDLGVFFIPPRLLWIDAIKNGEFPLWNPYSYSGHPLFATLQPGVLYPVNITLLILPFDIAFNLTIIIHFFLAGAFTFVLMRELKASPEGSLIAALIFMLGGYLFSAHNVMSTLFSVAWVPLAVFLFLRCMRRASLQYALLAGLALTVTFLGGGIEAFLGAAGLLFLMSLMPHAFDFDEEPSAWLFKPGLIKRLSLYGAAIAAFFVLSAIQLLPFIELARLSTRAGGLSFLEAATWSFDAKDFVQFFIPDPFGYGVNDEKYWANQSWLKTVYLGSIPFILSAFFFLRARSKSISFILIGLFFLSLAMGRNSLVYYLLHSYSPLFDKFRYPVKFLFVFFLFISISAGFGLEAVKKASEEHDRRAKLLLFGLLGLSTAAAIAFGLLNFFDADVRSILASTGMDYPEYNHISVNIFNAKRALFFLIAFSTGLYIFFNSKRTRWLLPYFTITMLSVDLFFAHNGYYSATRPADYYKKTAVAEFLAKDTGLYRVFVTPKTMDGNIEIRDTASFDRALLEQMDIHKERLSGYNLIYGIPEIGGVEVMKRGDYTNLFNLMAAQKAADSTSIPSMLNVKYVISIPRISSDEYSLVKVIGAKGGVTKGLEGEKTFKIYENRNYSPRFYAVGSYRVIKKPDEYANAIVDKRFDPAREVLLEEEPEGGVAKGKDPECKIEVVSYRNNSIELKADCKDPAILVASESWYPGWKAYVDGVERRILKADYVLRAVPVEAGSHTIKFVYRPASFRAGLYISAFGLALMVSLGVFYHVRRKGH